jgi:hypothetical protein
MYAIGGRAIEKRNHSDPLSPFLIAVLEVPRTKKI